MPLGVHRQNRACPLLPRGGLARMAKVRRATSDLMREDFMDVLIVDDSAAIRKILQRVLRQTDIPIRNVLEAGDGAQALQLLRSQPVGLILSDINMPNMDGLELLGHLKSNPEWRGVPVIMITTEGGQAKVMEAVQLGAAGYVRKPFTADQIKDKLAGVL
jgi:two-component system chemotaxis response regulator CheY